MVRCGGGAHMAVRALKGMMVRLWAHAAGVAGKTLQERWERWESVGTSEGAERRHETDNVREAGGGGWF